MRPEEYIETTVCRDAKEAGWTVRKVQFPGVRGAPDRLFGKDGRGVWIEFKRDGEVPRQNQINRANELREDMGYEVHSCDSIEEGRRILGLEG